jgi:CheY-like chemotaxis protein
VLIADDRKENRAVLVNMLLPLGFKILEAENGQECLEKTLTFKPDAILLDLRMPIVDGFETAKQIRQLDNLHDVVIIAVSASVYEEIQQKSLQAGCDVFLTKPVQLETILDILHTHLQLEWSYEEEQKSQLAVASKTHIDAELSIVLPEDQLKLLIELASKGRVKKLLQSLARIEASDQRYQPFIEELRQLTKNFQLKAVIECLEHTGDRA